MVFSYKTSGVCARSIQIEVEDEVVKSVRFEGGCSGNTQGVAELVKGMKVDEVIKKLENLKCGFKNTSCPAQLANALKNYKATKGE